MWCRRLERWFGRGFVRKALRRERYRPRLEVLEDRTALAAFAFASDVPVDIEDLNTQVSQIEIPVSMRIVDLDVQLEIEHTYDADLTVVLVAPNGTRVELFSEVGGSGNDFHQTVLDDAAGTSIANGSAPFTGRFQPSEPLATLVGADLRGIWTLEITDGESGDTGRLLGWSLVGTTSTYVSTSEVLVQDEETVSSSIVVPDSFLVADLEVSLAIQHTYDADLTVVLVAPNGTRVELFSEVGGSGNDFRSTTLDDQAAESINDGVAPFVGTFRPTGRLADFLGIDVNGTWTLEITDGFAGDEGILLGWSLDVTPVLQTSIFPSNSLRLRVPDPGTVTSSIQVTQSGVIHDLDVELNLPHSYTGDLSVRLQSPDGTWVRLFSRVGGSGDDFRGTVLDDQASRAISSGSPPFRGRFRPVEPLAAFAGKEMLGTWTLEVTDSFSDDVGILRGWSLKVTSVVPAARLPDLKGVAFTVLDDEVVWGDPVTVRYTLVNQGTADAAPFAVDVRVSPNTTITTFDPFVGRFTVPGLAAGEQYSGEVQLTLPGEPTMPPEGFSGLLTSYLGLVIDAEQEVQESDEGNNEGRYPGTDEDDLTVFTVFGEVESNDRSSLADPIASPARVQARIEDATDRDFYRLESDRGGRLTADLGTASGNPPPLALELYDQNGDLLVRADGVASGGSLHLIDQHLLPGTYFLAVVARAGLAPLFTSLPYHLDVRVHPATSPLLALDVGDFPIAPVMADLNGDGRLDVVVANVGTHDVSVLLGNGDGSFQREGILPAISSPAAVAVGDVNGDGRPDLLIANSGSDDVTVLLGNGDGSFRFGPSYLAGDRPYAMQVADVSGDGKLDLVVANQDSGNVSVLLGNGDGTFQQQRTTSTGRSPNSVEVVDFDEDGDLDLLIVNEGDATVALLTGDGQGEFSFARSIDVGTVPAALAVADLDGDQVLDLVVSNTTRGGISLLLGKDAFANRTFVPVGTGAEGLVVADFSGDGLADVVLVSVSSETASILVGRGDGTFLPPRSYNVGDDPFEACAGDIDGDGRLDLLVANSLSDDLTVLLGNGDGTFQAPRIFLAGDDPFAAVTEDVNGDGRPDLLVPNLGTDDVSVLLGNGDGTFQPARSVPAGDGPFMVVVADINRDSRPDMLVANLLTRDVKVLLGNGDGNFQSGQSVPLGSIPAYLTLADLDGKNGLELVVASELDDQIVVIPGNGDGTFQLEGTRSFSAGDGPNWVMGAFVNQEDRFLDLLVVNGDSNDVSILLGTGDGNFSNGGSFPAGTNPRGVIAADVNKDGFIDLVAANGDSSSRPTGDHDRILGDGPRSVVAADIDRDGHLDVLVDDFLYDGVSLLLGTADTSFGPPLFFDTRDDEPSYLKTRDLNGMGTIVLRRENFDSPDVALLRGDGMGSFAAATYFEVPHTSVSSLTVADVNGDDVVDLVLADPDTDEVRVRLGKDPSANTYSAFSEAQAVPPRNTPWLVDLDGDSTLDSVVLDDRGRILFRRGLPGRTNLYEPPVEVAPRSPARDVAPFQTGAGLALAAADTFGDAISVYRWNGQALILTSRMNVGRQPTRVMAGDLDGDHLADLVISSASTNSVFVCFQHLDGTFSTPREFLVGVAPVELLLTDVDGQTGIDIVICNRFSGDISILLNDDEHSFTSSLRYRAGLSVFGMEIVENRLHPRSLELPVSVAVGDVSGDGLLDLVVVAQEARQVRLLEGLPDGGFANPIALFSLFHPEQPAIERPGQVRLADLDHDGDLEILVLVEDRGELWIHGRDDDAIFVRQSIVAVGNAATGFTIADTDGDGRNDLLIGNRFGDVLIILGNGNGTFRPFIRTDRRVPFAVTDLDKDGRLDVVLADQARDRVGAFRRTGSADFTPGAFVREGNQLVGPGAVTVADVDDPGTGADLLFANTGSNNVLVYLRQPDGSFATEPLSYFVGTSPIALSVVQLNDDTNDGRIDARDYPDLVVANQGSNDVSILLGTRGRDVNGDGIIDASDSFRAGPRLQTGGRGPNALTIRDMDEDGIPDILATNGQSGTLATIPGLGNSQQLGTGFFDDASLTPLPITTQPLRQSRILSSNLGFFLTQDGSVLRVDLGTGSVTATPTAAVNAFDVLSSADRTFLFTANADGSASLLEETPDGFDLRQTFDTGLENPSALEVIERPGGLFELYLTDAGESKPVIVQIRVGSGLAQADGSGRTPFFLVAVAFTDFGEAEQQPSETIDLAEIFDPLSIGRSGLLTSPGVAVLAYVLGGEDFPPEGEEQEILAVAPDNPPASKPDLLQFILGLGDTIEDLELLLDDSHVPAERAIPHQESPAPLVDPLVPAALPDSTGQVQDGQAHPFLCASPTQRPTRSTLDVMLFTLVLVVGLHDLLVPCRTTRPLALHESES